MWRWDKELQKVLKAFDADNSLLNCPAYSEASLRFTGTALAMILKLPSLLPTPSGCICVGTSLYEPKKNCSKLKHPVFWFYRK